MRTSIFTNQHFAPKRIDNVNELNNLWFGMSLRKGGLDCTSSLQIAEAYIPAPITTFRRPSVSID